MNEELIRQNVSPKIAFLLDLDRSASDIGEHVPALVRGVERHKDSRVRIRLSYKLNAAFSCGHYQLSDQKLLNRLLKAAQKDRNAYVRSAILYTLRSVLKHQDKALFETAHLDLLDNLQMDDPVQRVRNDAGILAANLRRARPEFGAVSDLPQEKIDDLRDKLRKVVQSPAELLHAVESYEQERAHEYVGAHISEGVTLELAEQALDGTIETIKMGQWEQLTKVGGLLKKFPGYAKPLPRRNLVIIQGPNVKPTPIYVRNCLRGRGLNFFNVGSSGGHFSTGILGVDLQRAQSNGLPTTIIIYAHGGAKPDGHEVELNYGDSLDLKTLFGLCKKVFKRKPIDVFLFACYSGAAQTQLDALPKGSSLATVCSETEHAYQLDAKRLFDALRRGTILDQPLTANNLLRVFSENSRNSGKAIVSVSGGPS